MNLSPLPIQKFFGNNGRPLDGGLLFSYAAGTNNKIATYTDSTGGASNTNPVVLDFRGECRLWIDPTLAYKFVLSPKGDTDPPTNPIWTVDDITAGPAQQDNAADDTGSVNNIELSIPQISSPVAFTRIVFKAANSNTGATTITVNGGASHSLTWQPNGPLSGGEIIASGIYEAIFDGAQWQLQGPTLDPGDVRLYGAKGDGVTDDSAAVQTAINTGKTVIFSSGTYLANNLTTATNNQVFIGSGDVTIKKNANGALWTDGGRATLYFNVKWSGDASTPTFTGDNFVHINDNCTLLACGSRWAQGRAVKSTTGNGLRIIGTNDIYQTADATATGYDIELTGGGNYSRIISIATAQATGGVLADNAGGVSISDSQIGKLTAQNNAGVFATNNRINGAVAIRSSNNAMANNAMASDVTIGNGATPYSNISFGDTNIMAGGTTFSLESGVIDSCIHVGQLQDAGVTVVLNDGGDNFVVSRAIAYTPAWTASVSDPSIGNGSFPYANYTRKGRRVAVDVSLLMGSTTAFGTGIWRIGLPFPVVTNKGATGAAWGFDATNVPYTLIAEAASTLGYVTFYANAVGGQVGAAIPFAWAQDDRLRFSIEYDIG